MYMYMYILSRPCVSAGIGFSDGEVRILCSLTLEDRSHPFNYSTEPITVIAFSTGPRIYMATAVSNKIIIIMLVFNNVFIIIIGIRFDH